MAKVKDSHSEMAQARQSDGINVIFDQESSSSSHSHSRSRSPGVSSRSSGSGRHRGRGSNRRRYRSSSSSCSRSSSHSRSRSHPRCHRRSSRCRCDNHPRYGRGRYRAHSRSLSRSTSPDRYSRHSQHKSGSRSSSRQIRRRRDVSRLRNKSSRSSSRANRSRSKSRASTHSASLSLDDKTVVLNAAEFKDVTIQGTEKLELLESVEPILSEQSAESRQSSPDTWVRHDPDERTPSQSDEVEPDDMPSPKMSPTRKIISFSINNSVAKPTVAAASCAKVTPRVDIYESRKPYGHWVPVKTGHNSRKRTLAIL